MSKLTHRQLWLSSLLVIVLIAAVSGFIAWRGWLLYQDFNAVSLQQNRFVAENTLAQEKIAQASKQLVTLKSIGAVDSQMLADTVGSLTNLVTSPAAALGWDRSRVDWIATLLDDFIEQNQQVSQKLDEWRGLREEITEIAANPPYHRRLSVQASLFHWAKLYEEMNQAELVASQSTLAQQWHQRSYQLFANVGGKMDAYQARYDRLDPLPALIWKKQTLQTQWQTFLNQQKQALATLQQSLALELVNKQHGYQQHFATYQAEIGQIGVVVFFSLLLISLWLLALPLRGFERGKDISLGESYSEQLHIDESKIEQVKKLEEKFALLERQLVDAMQREQEVTEQLATAQEKITLSASNELKAEQQRAIADAQGKKALTAAEMKIQALRDELAATQSELTQSLTLQQQTIVQLQAIEQQAEQQQRRQQVLESDMLAQRQAKQELQKKYTLLESSLAENIAQREALSRALTKSEQALKEQQEAHQAVVQASDDDSLQEKLLQELSAIYRYQCVLPKTMELEELTSEIVTAGLPETMSTVHKGDLKNVQVQVEEWIQDPSAFLLVKYRRKVDQHFEHWQSIVALESDDHDNVVLQGLHTCIEAQIIQQDEVKKVKQLCKKLTDKYAQLSDDYEVAQKRNSKLVAQLERMEPKLDEHDKNKSEENDTSDGQIWSRDIIDLRLMDKQLPDPEMAVEMLTLVPDWLDTAERQLAISLAKRDIPSAQVALDGLLMQSEWIGAVDLHNQCQALQMALVDNEVDHRPSLQRVTKSCQTLKMTLNNL